MNAHRRIEDRLADVLLDAVPGGAVCSDELRRNRGYWAQHKQDVYAWEGVMQDAEGENIQLYSWELMSKCVKRGVTLEPEGFKSFLVWAKERP